MFQVFNASGHPIHSENVRVIGKIEIPNVNLSNANDVANAAQVIADAAAPHVREGAIIAMPGASVLAVHVLAAIHGLTGHWPTIAWAARMDGTFTWSKKQICDLHDLRTAQRVRERA